jgi:hypothetical protein
MMPTQRDYMRNLKNKFNNNKDHIINAYAQGERNGDVKRIKDKHNLSPENYAERLYYDGIRKNWL